MTDSKAFVYSLSDPKTKEVRYIGRSKNPEHRLKTHLFRAKHRLSPLSRWIDDIVSDGLEPIMYIIEEVSIDEMDQREVFWIKHYLPCGLLLNKIKYVNPKDIRYKTAYFPNDGLFEKVQTYAVKNKIDSFNQAILKLVALGLGEEIYPIVSDKRIRSIVRDELQKARTDRLRDLI